jgi:amino acid adenylation domain-containing protein
LFDNISNSLGVDVDLAATPPADVDFVLERAYDRYCATRALIGSVRSCQPVMADLLGADVDEIACFVDFGVPAERMIAALPRVADLQAAYGRPAAPAREEITRASDLQRRMWLVDRMDSTGQTYQEPKAILLRGPLDVPALLRAVQRVVDRQPQLRSVFREIDGELQQVTLPHVTADCHEVDLTGCATDTEAVENLHASEVRGPMDLADGPLFKARIARLADDRHLLYLVAHHIVFDSTSTLVFCRDLAAFYRAGSDGDAGLPDVGPSRPAEAPTPPAERVQAWRRRLAEVPELNLPADRAHPPRSAPHGASLTRHLDAGTSSRIPGVARATGSTVFMTLLTAVGSVIGRFAQQDDVLIGTSITDRPPGSEHAVGMYAETVAIRLGLAGATTFRELAERTRGGLLWSVDHRDVPFDEVVRAVNPQRRPHQNPLFRVMVEFEDHADLDLAGTGLTAELLDVPRTQAPVDLTFYFTARTGDMRCTVEYNALLFDGTTVDRLVDYIEDFLHSAVRDPDGAMSQWPALTARDTLLLRRWQGARQPLPELCLHDLVQEQATRTPDAIAVAGCGARMTYAQLEEAATRLARRWAARRIGRGARVGICLARGPEQIIAILATLKCGAAYVPMEPSLPAHRRRLMLADSRVGMLVTDGGAALPDPPCPVFRIDGEHPEGSEADPGGAAGPGDTAYLIYTSGSTGTPKAVVVPHRGAVNLVQWQMRRFPALHTLHWSSIAFDVSVQQIFGTLASGATLVLIADQERHDPAAVATRMREHGVQRLGVTPSALRILAPELAGVPSLTEVLIAGERLVPTDELRDLAAARADIAFHNQYGPTEASIIVTSARVDPCGAQAPSIGSPVDNVTLRVIGPDDRQVPIGVAGELLIGGMAPADGYLGDPELTRSRFVTGAPAGWERAYRSGDLVRWRLDGQLDYLGRLDDQVKIRGFRVEPQEVEHALRRLDDVSAAAVVVGAGNDGDAALAAFVVPRGPVSEDSAWTESLRRRLAAELPAHCVPVAWTVLTELPTAVSGKVDRRALATAVPVTGTGDPRPSTVMGSTEERVRQLWTMELGAAAIEPEQSFFDLGGNSLSAVRLLERIRVELGIKVPMVEFLGSPTIRSVAERVTAAGGPR